MEKDKCALGECVNDPQYKSDFVVPALPSDEGGGGGGGGSIVLRTSKAASSANEAYATSYLNSVLDGLQHDVENLEDLTPTVLNSETSTPKADDVYSASYINSMIGNINTALETIISGAGV